MNQLGQREAQVKKVLYITMFLNFLSATVKIWAGKSFLYLSLTSSGIESIFDGFGNVVLIIAIVYASLPSDKNHNYGHYKFENLGSVILSLLLFTSAIALIFEYKENILSGNRLNSQFGVVPILSIIVSMSISLFVSTYEKREGRRLKSKLLMADGDHTRGDFILSFGVLISIIASKFNFLFLDLAVGVLIIIYLIYLAIKIARNNLDDLLDSSPEIQEVFLQEIVSLSRVCDIHKFRARGNSHWMNIDFHLLVDPTLNIVEAHDLSHEAEDLLRNRLSEYCQNIDITIHIEPCEKNYVK